MIYGKNKENFEYNKDAGMYVCKAGHMAIRKAKQGNKEKGTDVECYYFDVEKCKHCPYKDGCYKEALNLKVLELKLKVTHILHKWIIWKQMSLKKIIHNDI